ncbi:hypothetical protein DEEACLCL_00113 [Salmonella phage CRW-SP2]|nr:hypothetical protein DEEACLCL_00113 [Salmonella phage CRW-SP2]
MAAQEMNMTEATGILEKIKKEMMERRQLTAQNKTNRHLEDMNKNLQKLNSSLERESNKQPPVINIKFPTVAEIVGGFIHSSPIFGRAFSTWMADSLSAARDNTTELERIASKIEGLGQGSTNKEDSTLNTEYLDMISTQLDASNSESLKRLDDSSSTLTRIHGTLVRIEDNDKSMMKLTDNSLKAEKDQLVRLFSIENKIGVVGGHIVGYLKRIFDAQEKERQKTEFRRGEEGKEVGGAPRADVVTPTPQAGDDNDSSSSGIMAAIATMLGLNTLKAFLGKPFRAIGRVFGKFFGMFTKLGEGTEVLLGPFGKALKFMKAGPLALISTLFDFGKGFFNASEILGKKENLTIIDRMRAGTVELLGGLGDLADWVGNLFGFDTQFGKSIREEWLKISEPLAKFSQSIVDWFKNDLFGGITKGTALTDIPGKIADNFKTEMGKFGDWISQGFTDFLDDGMKAIDNIMADIKSGFAEKVKKPFINMVNTITNSMFDLVDKFVEIIPDSLGGEAARKKMMEARQSMLITTDEQTTPEQANPAAPAGQGNAPSNAPKTLEMLPPEQNSGVTNVTGKTDLGWSYAAPSSTIQGAAPVAGKAISNIDQMKSTYGGVPPSVNMPVQQNVDNSKKISTTNNFNSTSLEPVNKTDNARILWDY